MNRIEKITHLAKNTLLETNLELKDKGKTELKRDINRLLKKINSGNFGSLATIPNSDIFQIFAILLFEDSSYEEISGYILEAKDSINSWTYNRSSEDLRILFDNTNYGGVISDSKYLKNYNNLNLIPAFLNCPMKFVYKAMLAFLKLKKSLLDQPQQAQKQLPSPLFVMTNPDILKGINTRPKTPKEIYETSEFHGFVKVLEDQMAKEIKEYEDRREKLFKRKSAYEELIESLKNPKFSEITSIPDKWHQYLDLPTLEEIYYLIQDNLFREKRELLKEEESLNAVLNNSELSSYLYSKQINPNSFPKDIISTLEQIPNVTNRIEVLTILGFNIIDIINDHYDLLTYLTDEKIKKITFLINSHAISKKTLRDNIHYIIDEKYSELMTNYAILKPIVDFNNIFYNDNIMFVNPRELRSRLSILAEYKLTKNNFIFLLCHYNYLNIYDLLIEQDIPEYLFISICKTRNPQNTIKRIMIYRLIGEEIETPNHLLKKELTDETKFACLDSALDEYIINYVPCIILEPVKGHNINTVKKDPIVKLLDENYRIDDLYIIGGISISRAKFLRNFEEKRCNPLYIVPSLISNSILEESSVYSIFKELEEKKLKK